VTIGLICAIPQELGHLRAAMTHTGSARIAHVDFDTGTIDGYHVVLAGSGMGKVNSALVATVLAD
jgi:adenosylhomocysteine nucleosidase